MQIFAVNNPRASYFIGGGEMVSMEHAKHFALTGNKVYFFTINPESVQLSYTGQYLKFKQDYCDKICFVEIEMDSRATNVYKSLPDKVKHRWYNEALLYNRGLYSALDSTGMVFDGMISCFNLDAIVFPSEKVKKNIVYLSGVPDDENIFRTSFLAMYDCILAITDDVRDYWQKYCPRKISVVHTGVDLDLFHPVIRSENEKLNVIFMGRLIERKGCATLLRAIAKLSTDIQNLLDIKVIGVGPQQDELISLATELNISNIVNFVGRTYCPQEYFQHADIAVFPSRRGEGLQGVILEAMASGVCVIASNTKINAELLNNNCGILIDPENIDDIADKIQYCFQKRNLCKQIGKNARKFVEKNYDWNIIIKKLQEVIK